MSDRNHTTQGAIRPTPAVIGSEIVEQALVERRQPAAPEELTDDAADALLAEIDAKAALLTLDDMDRIEQKWRELMTVRRCSLVMLTRPFADLRSDVEESRDFAVAVAEALRKVDLDFYQGMATLIDTARVWLLMALACREDMAEIMAEAGGDDAHPQ